MSRPRIFLSLGVASLALIVLAGAAAATSAKTMSVRMTFTGAYKGVVSWTHVQNGPGTRLITYGCVQWTVPGKPLRYAVIFGEAGYDSKQSLVLKFDYQASELGRAHRLRTEQLVGLAVIPPDRTQYATYLRGKAPVSVMLAPDLRSGTFVARNLENFPPATRRLLHVTGTWKCASVIRRRF